MRNSDNAVSSSGTFIGANGNTIHWEAVSSLRGEASLDTSYTFTVDANTPGPIGPLRVYQYLDADIQDPNDDVFGTVMNSGTARIVTVDGIERFGVAQLGANNSFNATFAGLAADSFNHIQERIMGSGQPVAPTNSGITHAEINLPFLTGFTQDLTFVHYGPRNVVSVLAWDIDPDVDDAEISTTLHGVNPLLGPPTGHSDVEITHPTRPIPCAGSTCRVRVDCNLLVTRCVNRIALFARLSDGLQISFASGVANVAPSETEKVKLKLTKCKKIVKRKRGKTLYGVLETKNASGTVVSSTPIRIRIR